MSATSVLPVGFGARRVAEEWSGQVAGGNFASLTDYPLLRKSGAKPSPMMASETSAFALVRKGEAEPSPVTPSKAFPFAQRAVPAPAPVDMLVPAGPTPQSTLHVVPDPVDVQLSANEYKALSFVADKKSTTPQHLLRQVLRNFIVEFFEHGEVSRS